MKKRFIIIFSLFWVIIIASLFFIKPNTNRFEQIKNESSKIVKMIKSGDIQVKSNGCIVLPEDLSHISDSGECFLVEFQNSTAIYFYTFRGVSSSSKGYIYVTDELTYEEYINTEVYVGTMDFVNIKEIEKDWYSCSTD